MLEIQYEYPIVGPIEYGDSCLIPKVRVHHPEINGSWNAVEAPSKRWEGLGRDNLEVPLGPNLGDLQPTWKCYLRMEMIKQDAWAT